MSSSPNIPARSGRQGGFTLVEVMLAITLVALIMAMAYGGFRAGVRATGSGEALIEETNRMRVAHEFVRRQISLAQPLIIEETVDGEQVRFEGDRDRIRFVAPMPGYLSFGGSYVQELRFERGSEGTDLVFAWAMLNGYQPGDLERVDPIALLENISGGQFDYLGFDDRGEELFWERSWWDPESVPLAVALQLDMDRDSGLFWPELITPLRIDAVATQPRRMRPADILNPVERHRPDARR